MRPEIMNAIDAARRINSSNEDWASHQTPTGQILPGDYSSMLSTEQKNNLERIYETVNSLKSCLEVLPQVKSVEAAKTTALEVYVNQTSAYVVVEVSIYGSLATIFKYGSISSDLEQHIEHCLAASKLTLITDVERTDLESTSLYDELF